MAIMIGTIITVRITTETSRLAPLSWTTNSTDFLSAAEMMWLPTNGTKTRTPIRPKITDGTAASSRTTGTMIARRRSGANSTMKIEASSAKTRPKKTARPVVRSVPQISGQARRW